MRFISQKGHQRHGQQKKLMLLFLYVSIKMICLNKTRLTQHFGTVFQMIWRNMVISQQCSNKWKSLKRSYMETIDHNTKTGEAPKSCKYYSELNQLFGNKPSAKPDFTLHSSESSDCSTSSSNKKEAQKLVSENKHQLKYCSDDNEFNVVTPKKKKKDCW